MKRILIIEDQAPMRRNPTQLLRLEGYTVLSADNGLTGLDLARKEQPDVILCDDDADSMAMA